MEKFLGKNALLYLWQKIKTTFVEKEPGKGLSANDLTDELKQKILNAGDSSFSGNYADLTGVPTVVSAFENDAGYQTANEVNIIITSKGQQIADNVLATVDSKGYQTAAEVMTAILSKGYLTAQEIAALIAAADHLKREIVTELPVVADADENTIYMVPAEDSEENNNYIEWFLINGEWERIGSTEVDLTNYWSKSNLTEMSNEDIDDLLALI